MNFIHLFRGAAMGALLAAPLASQAVLDISASLNMDKTLALKIGVTGPAGGTGYILLGTERMGPFPTPFGPLWIMPPVIAATVPLGSTGMATLTFTVPTEVGAIGGVLQAATVNASGGDPLLSNYVLLGYTPPGIVLADEGGCLSYNQKDGSWGAGGTGPAGAKIEVWIIEKQPPHAILLKEGRIGRDGFGELSGTLTPPLNKNQCLQLKVNGKVITTAK